MSTRKPQNAKRHTTAPKRRRLGARRTVRVSLRRGRVPRSTPRAAAVALPAPPPVPPEVDAIDDTAELLFVGLYLANGLNATRAYQALRPGVTDRSAATEGYKLRHRPTVDAAIRAQTNATWSVLKMETVEALARLSLHIRADIRELYDEQGVLLPVHLWPDSTALSVEQHERKWDGSHKVKLASKLQALHTLLEVEKKVSGPGGDLGALLDAVAEKRAQLQAAAASSGGAA